MCSTRMLKSLGEIGKDKPARRSETGQMLKHWITSIGYLQKQRAYAEGTTAKTGLLPGRCMRRSSMEQEVYAQVCSKSTSLSLKWPYEDHGSTLKYG